MWFVNRKNVKNFNEVGVCQKFQSLRKLTAGGQSDIYLYDIEGVLVRKISPEFQTNYKSEIATNLLLTAAVMENINPHFTITYEIKKCNSHKSIYQLIEKFDGDISGLKTNFLTKTSFYPQMLMGLVTLITNDVTLNDVKPENILYHQLPEEITLGYEIDGATYCVETNVIYSYTDYGNAGRYETKNIKNVSDLNSIVKIAKGKKDVAHISTDFFTEFDVDGKICGYDAMSAKSIFNTLAGNKAKLLRCVKDKIKYMSQTGIIGIGGNADFLFKPGKQIEKISVD